MTARRGSTKSQRAGECSRREARTFPKIKRRRDGKNGANTPLKPTTPPPATDSTAVAENLLEVRTAAGAIRKASRTAAFRCLPRQ